MVWSERYRRVAFLSGWKGKARQRSLRSWHSLEAVAETLKLLDKRDTCSCHPLLLGLGLMGWKDREHP